MNKIGKWSTKKKITVSVLLVVLAGIIAFIAYRVLRPDPQSAVTVTTVGKGDITQTLSLTGKVESGNQGKFEILKDTKVEQVNFRVGDTFKKGDVLATFDVSSIRSVVTQKKNAYDNAEKAYREYLKNSKSATAKLDEINKEIAELEKSSGETKSEEEKQEQTKKYKTKVGEWIAALLNGGRSQSNSLLGGMLTGSVDLSSMLGISGASSNEMRLMQLQLEKTVLETQSAETLSTVYQKLAESAEAEYTSIKSAMDMLEKGWTAEYDGIVREVNMTAGSVFTPDETAQKGANIDLSALISGGTTNIDLLGMLSDLFNQSYYGMIVEYYPFTASFTLDKYDVFKVSMDQKVKVTSSNGKTYDGVVTYISPVATESGGINISSIISSAGGSNSGVEAKISILNPDESVIIGFDVDIEIETENEKDVIVVPIEALQYSNDATYVYLYDKGTKTVKKTEVETGIFSGTQYQIISGCKEGDVIVKSPSLTLKDGEKIVAAFDEK
ncbi:MAG: hypothetical protein K5756_07355 [Clostridiales bacterium]|nr:hypothetical protein [Clostridiales bacterium]